jgi:hypothetical protein
MASHQEGGNLNTRWRASIISWIFRSKNWGLCNWILSLSLHSCILFCVLFAINFNGRHTEYMYLCCISIYNISRYSSRHSDWLWAGRPRGRSSSPDTVNNFYFTISSRSALGVKQPGREADHSPPTSADVKKTGIYTATPPHAFMA